MNICVGVDSGVANCGDKIVFDSANRKSIIDRLHCRATTRARSAGGQSRWRPRRTNAARIPTFLSIR